MEKRVVFNEDLCKGCSLCVSVCPKDIIFLADHLNGKGYRPATVVDQEACISCVACGRICPDGVITVYRPERKKTAS
ncbi:ferredoxin family protein [Tepidibacillus infernus]|uniref:4Fe-4S dicluster domain-containing protein n=1 Tax=Tepidibacillus TaxID=1494427 RepID=UPI000852CD07|nr:4Fe-4S binding protein [Tepidibacillus sp. HK-1]GBF11060.1 2-oxoglutarate-acceptor oxidoreductase subunit OorD [Tepidibacillus sp. HK-1]